MLIVNTASKCKFTPQFDDLQKLYDKYKEKGFEILGFPCNQFDAQEPGTSEEAASFCQINYGVKFPIFTKIDVNGKDTHPLFTYLKQEAPFKGFDEANITEKLLKLKIAELYPEWLVGDEIKWNFTKFLIDQNGNVVERFEPSTEPMDFEQNVKQLLA
ncbi:glutathione peroxidase [Bacillus kexueae]|uniref:glutathione peroxidase n=1 Tax=Aeribacillus kexueae TaxID=2078952 RepID=UPI00311A9C75